MSALHVADETATPVPPLKLVADAGAEQAVAAAERALDRADYAAAVAALEGRSPSTRLTPALALRALFAESWARMYLGELDEAVALLERARTLAEGPVFGDADRAEALYRLGCVRFRLGSIANAIALFTVALELCDRSGLPCTRLRAHVLEWRARCYQRRRDWDAARADVETGLDLVGQIGDRRSEAHLYLQASLIAERRREWLLARCYAEEALARYEAEGDRENVHKVLNNLGGIQFLLGRAEEAVACLQESFRIALDLGNEVGAAYAMSSLAQIQLRGGDLAAAERHARRAADLLADRDDHAGERGNAQLVLGRALLEQGRLDDAGAAFAAAEASLARLASPSHLAAAWIARGDLAARRGDCEAAAALYRQAAESLQDVHF